MLCQRLFRSARSRISHHRASPPIRGPFGPARCRYPNPVQHRAYRPINYRHFLTSWNTLREWVRTPLFYYNVAGISLLCGLFYAHYLERVPVSHFDFGLKRHTKIYKSLGIWTFTLQHHLFTLGRTISQETLARVYGGVRG
jgi:hypothetical protein